VQPVDRLYRDMVMITRLDRLARSIRNLSNSLVAISGETSVPLLQLGRSLRPQQLSFEKS